MDTVNAFVDTAIVKWQLARLVALCIRNVKDKRTMARLMWTMARMDNAQLTELVAYLEEDLGEIAAERRARQ